MQFLSNSKTIAVITTALFVGSLFWLMNAKRVNSSLEEGLQKEKLTSESLLAEKLSLEKDIAKFKEQLSSLNGRNHELDDLVQSTTARFNRQEADYNRLKKENLSLAGIRKQRQELVALKSSLENEIQSLRMSYQQMEQQNRELNNTVASLQERNRLLNEDLNRARFASVDQIQIQALRKNSKLTAKAKRTGKLIASFEVAANLKNLSYRITDPKGNLISAHDGAITSTSVPSEKNYVASNGESVPGKDQFQQVEMVFTPAKKLTSGMYTIELLNDNLHVGSVKVKLK